MRKKTSRQSGWKTHQTVSKTKKRTKLALIVLGLLVSLMLIYQLINFIKIIHRPFNSSVTKNYTWSGEFNLNLVLTTKPISLFSYNPREKSVTIMTIPDETYIDVPGRFGKWQVRSIYELGKTSNLSGNELLRQSLSSFLGIPIDGFSSINLADVFRGNIFSGITLLPKMETDLTLMELTRLKIGLLGVRFDKIKQIDLLDLGILERQKLADSTQILVADPVRVDSVLSDFADGQISAEHMSISIFNATDKPLLAQRAKRLITNLGGNVIALENAPRVLKKSYVEGDKSKTLERLNQIFNPSCKIESQKCDRIPKEELGTVVGRAQIIVVLGEDFP